MLPFSLGEIWMAQKSWSSWWLERQNCHGASSMSKLSQFGTMLTKRHGNRRNIQNLVEETRHEVCMNGQEGHLFNGQLYWTWTCAKFKATELQYPPSNTTALLQLMDQGIIHNLKVKYFRHALQRLFLCMDSVQGLPAGSSVTGKHCPTCLEWGCKYSNRKLLWASGLFEKWGCYVGGKELDLWCRESRCRTVISRGASQSKDYNHADDQ